MPHDHDLVFPLDRLRVEPWSDPTIDSEGVDPRSSYAEWFWLPVLGPSTVWFLRRMVERLDREPHGFDLDLAETARALGVGMRGGRNSPMVRAIDRSCRFGAARRHDDRSLEVRRRLPRLGPTHLDRLPPSLRARHDLWLRRPDPSPADRHRAQAMARSMLELGEAPEAVERHLRRWRFEPSVVVDAVRRAETDLGPAAVNLSDGPGSFEFDAAG